MNDFDFALLMLLCVGAAIGMAATLFVFFCVPWIWEAIKPFIHAISA